MENTTVALSTALLGPLVSATDSHLNASNFAQLLKQILEETGNVYQLGRISLYHVMDTDDGASSEADTGETLKENGQHSKHNELPMHTAAEQNACFSQDYSWNSSTGFEIENKDAQRIPFHPYYTRWLETLKTGNKIVGETSSFPPIEQELLNALDTASTLIIPDCVSGYLRGFIAFDRLSHQSKAFGPDEQDELFWLSRLLFRALENKHHALHQEAEIESYKNRLYSKNQILANLSHEIRTPMNGIVGLAEQLEDLESNMSKRSFIENIKLSAANLMEVLTEIAEFSKSDDPDCDTSEDILSISKELLPVVRLYEEKAADKNLKLSVEVPDNAEIQFLGDYYRIRNVLKNLVDNAIKFTQKGYIKISFLLDELSDGPELVINVEDSGIGISKDKQNYVFEKYAQVEQGFTRSYSGIGLGLSIVKNTLAVLDGSIELQSDAGKGSHFRVHIPVKLVDKELGSRGIVTPETLTSLRFLVVDDHPINRKVVTTILKHWKSSFEVATNGLEAVEKSEKADFDIILMDIQMPVMDGYTAARKIRALKGDKTFILALTASILKEDEQHCLDAGMNGIIRKPFFPDNLRYWIKNLNVQNVPIMNINSTSQDSEFDHHRSEDSAGSASDTGRSSSESADNAKVTDLGYLKDISDGNAEFMQEMINLFIDQSGDHTGNIQEGITNGDYDKIAGAAHKMKPVLGYVGVAPEASMIRDIEIKAKAHDPLQDIQELLDTLNQVVDQANDELKAYLKER